MHKPIAIKHLELSFSHKLCFESFTTTILPGSRIAIIGRNGSGKSTLLNILRGTTNPTNGQVDIPDSVNFGYVSQLIESAHNLSGGQRFNDALTKALAQCPDILLLDEPTNHLDQANRKSLLRCLANFPGTLIVVSHDVELLRHTIDTLWHIDQGKVHIFTGHYDDYMRQRRAERTKIEHELSALSLQKKSMHQNLMKEQTRACKSKEKGKKSIEQRKWPTIVSTAKMARAQESSGRKKSALDQKKQELVDHLETLRLPEVIVPTFSIHTADFSDRVILSIHDGCVTYASCESVSPANLSKSSPFLKDIHFSLLGTQRLAITGQNGSGKSTLVKAILGDPSVLKTGEWYTPKRQDIGYLDQNYATLDESKTVLESLGDVVPTWDHVRLRPHLNDFLFRKNEEVHAFVHQLSGGERARLSLALIAAQTLKLLILDEITNNLDIETREHVIDVLKNYPGAMIVISHDADFLDEIGIADGYSVEMSD